MKTFTALRWFRFACALALASSGLMISPRAAETGSSLTSDTASTNAPAEMRLTPHLLEQLRREIEQSQARQAEAVAASLNLVEPALARMQERQAETLRSANRTILIVAGIFAGVGFFALVIITLILVRALGRFSEAAAMGPPVRRELGLGAEPPAPGAAPDRAAEQTSVRFQGAIDQLQRRILELEHSLHSTPAVAPPSQFIGGPRVLPMNLNGPAVPVLEPSSRVSPEASEPAPRPVVLLGKGQTLLNVGEAKEALACFEQALGLNPRHPEAWVKKGQALEQLEQWEEALASYDRALSLDSSLTVAFLYKGGVCNRLQRYQEALQSYEQALKSERKSVSS